MDHAGKRTGWKWVGAVIVPGLVAGGYAALSDAASRYYICSDLVSYRCPSTTEPRDRTAFYVLVGGLLLVLLAAFVVGVASRRRWAPLWAIGAIALYIGAEVLWDLVLPSSGANLLAMRVFGLSVAACFVWRPFTLQSWAVNAVVIAAVSGLAALVGDTWPDVPPQTSVVVLPFIALIPNGRPLGKKALPA